MDRTVNVQFFRVRRKDREGLQFSDCLRQLGGLALGDREHIVDENITVRLDQFEEQAGYIHGLFLRTQIDNLPPKVQLGLPAEPLGLPQGYALSHSVVFQYHPGLSVLALEHNRRSVSLSKIDAYLSEAFNAPGFYFDPILNLDAWRQLNATTPRKVTIRVAEPDQLEAVENDQLTTKESLRRFKQLSGGAHVEVSFSMGHHRGSLRSRQMRAISNWMLRESDEYRGGVSKIRIEGQDEEGEGIALDLLHAQLGEKALLNLPDDPVQSFEIRNRHVSAVVRRNWPTVRQQFGEPN